MSILQTMDEASASGDKRKDVRWRIRLELPGSLNEEADVVIHDLSIAGMLVETDARLDVGQSFTISLPEADTVAARVVWRDGGLFGCRFEKPLAQAVVSATKLQGTAPIAPVKREETLASRLLRLRQASGLSRTALSDRTGLSKPSIWAWETGRAVPRRANLAVLAEVYGLTHQQLLRGEEDAVPAAPGDEHFSRTLHDAIAEARNRIAALAGVETSMVRISIDF